MPSSRRYSSSEFRDYDRTPSRSTSTRRSRPRSRQEGPTVLPPSSSYYDTRRSTSSYYPPSRSYDPRRSRRYSASYYDQPDSGYDYGYDDYDEEEVEAQRREQAEAQRRAHAEARRREQAEIQRRYEDFAAWEESQIDTVTNSVTNRFLPEVENSLWRLSAKQGAPESRVPRADIARSIAHEIKETLKTEVDRRRRTRNTRGDIRSVQIRSEGLSLTGDGKELTIKKVSIYGNDWSCARPRFDMEFTSNGGEDDEE
ncbi:hypothetical protein L202_01061 [Cryptococcus amylolentus CBS 6039]|uniref:Uncharacterized protein n=2 Tax=Cryptococcus amylolentus TaxID=104669 RepID=A0A1E3I351_9TREE|nr:hypothetical protein L202_01061 [Cryptococcus amylolentus CBS 6039]ODN82785.1 hypothetical protein L202_01061 [Cryptococcus amylolentus CBS 6039]ODO10456.1 hypothetical protein I350_01051 [Cryptococcus amylolentus CBS 6273]